MPIGIAVKKKSSASLARLVGGQSKGMRMPESAEVVLIQ
jgi:hypothetical protein